MKLQTGHADSLHEDRGDTARVLYAVDDMDRRQAAEGGTRRATKTEEPATTATGNRDGSGTSAAPKHNSQKKRTERRQNMCAHSRGGVRDAQRLLGEKT